MWREAEKWDSSWSRVGGIGMGVRDGRAWSMLQANENDPEKSKRLMIQELEGYLVISTRGRKVGLVVQRRGTSLPGLLFSQ